MILSALKAATGRPQPQAWVVDELTRIDPHWAMGLRVAALLPIGPPAPQQG